MTEQLKAPLPDALMEAVKVVCASDMTASNKYVATILITAGYGLWQREDSYDPQSYAIPDQQWQAICELLMHTKDGDAIGEVNLSLDWMNQGPSGYKETP